MSAMRTRIARLGRLEDQAGAAPPEIGWGKRDRRS
jgi:hypothetical protein